MNRLALGPVVGVAMALAAAACGGGSSGGETADASGGGTADHQAGTEGGATEGSVDGTGGGADGGDGGVTDATGVDAPAEAGPFVTAPHPAWPNLPANGSVVMNNMKLVIVASTGDTYLNDYFSYGDTLIGSTWWQSFAPEYGLGTPTAAVHVTGPAITADPDTAAMRSYIASAIAGTPAAAADGNTLYMLYLPPGIDILNDSAGKPNTNCVYYGGYHTTYDQAGDAFGVVQHCPTQGTGLNDLQWPEIASSHEIAEAATDPQPGQGFTLVSQVDYSAPWLQPPWAIAIYGEVGDMCAGTQLIKAYQRIWSNAAAAKGLDPCVPAYAQYAYVNASAPKGWYTTTAGKSVQIPVTGWSDRATQDWIIQAQVYNSNVSAALPFTATITSPTQLPADAGGYTTTNNGGVSTLVVTPPASAGSGAWATVLILSVPQVFSGDPYHEWYVGVYIQ